MNGLHVALEGFIEPALVLLPPRLTSYDARVLLLAVALQETHLVFRTQKTGRPYDKGPGRGLWFQERPSVERVMTDRNAKDAAIELCKDRGVPYDCALVHAKLEYDDTLAAGFARLLFFVDPKPLPKLSETVEGWETYLRCWRPAKQRLDDWVLNHAAAREAVASW